MKVLQDGKEVKGAKVFYNVQSGAPLYVEIEGVNYDALAFKFEGAKDNVVKKGDVMSTESIQGKEDESVEADKTLAKNEAKASKGKK